MFDQDAVHPIELESSTWNTANCIQAINDIVSLLPTKARQLESQQEDIHVVIQNQKEWRHDKIVTLTKQLTSQQKTSKLMI